MCINYRNDVQILLFRRDGVNVLGIVDVHLQRYTRTIDTKSKKVMCINYRNDVQISLWYYGRGGSFVVGIVEVHSQTATLDIIPVEIKTAIKTLFLYFNLCLKRKVGWSLMFIYIHMTFLNDAYGLRIRRSWRGVLDTTLCDKFCQLLAVGRWFSPGTPVFSTNKTCRHDMTYC